MSVLKYIKFPINTAKLIWRRLFPFGIVPKDMEAYRIGSWSYGKLKREPVNELFPGLKQTDIVVLRSFDKDHYTSLTGYETMVICALVKLFSPEKLIEIGTYDGNTTLNIAANTPENSVIWTIDLPVDWAGHYTLSIPSFYDNVTDRKHIGFQFWDYPQYKNKIKQVFADSASLNWYDLTDYADFIFIDGNHHYKYVLSDTENALRILNPKKGMIVWHDYGMIEDVSKVVDEISTEGLHVHAIRGTRFAIAYRI